MPATEGLPGASAFADDNVDAAIATHRALRIQVAHRPVGRSTCSSWFNES
jgi:hypothetical protein